MEKVQREDNTPVNADKETNGVEAAAAAPAAPEGAAEDTAAPTAEEDEEAKVLAQVGGCLGSLPVSGGCRPLSSRGQEAWHMFAAHIANVEP